MHEPRTAPPAGAGTNDLAMACRACGAPVRESLVDLGMSPLCESFVPAESADAMEPFYPLHVFVCDQCFLAQLREYVSAEAIFREYAYFSSYSDSWLRHAEEYTAMATTRFGLGPKSRVVELASNDGYLLQYFVRAGIPVLGVEPAANVAKVAEERGVRTLVAFFGPDTAQKLRSDGWSADLMVGNNVLAQVPDLNGFVAGIKIGLGEHGVVTLEFPHIVRLIEENQFDTIYHEHFSYFSLSTVSLLFGRHGLTVFDVEEIPTHGGSLRVYARHSADNSRPVGPRVGALLAEEERIGVRTLEYYRTFAERVKETKRKLLEFLIQAKREGKRVVGYGAPGKGNTLLNYCGIRTDFIDFTVDRSPYKQGKFLPGTHIPIYAPARLEEARPDYVLILPWNLREEIVKQLAGIREWGGRFVVPIPTLRVW
jgi:C-methyltransferase-like protein/putative zinc binding protein/methyltransferase family protein